MITAAQCRAGRALLNWSQSQLSEMSLVSRATVSDFESEFRDPHKGSKKLLASALEVGGVEFIESGVRMKVKA
jgi:transcriptional regulator with XRE-family HTH domain